MYVNKLCVLLSGFHIALITIPFLKGHVSSCCHHLGFLVSPDETLISLDGMLCGGNQEPFS